MCGRMVEQKEKYKIIVITILLAGACVLTYYFHAILDHGRVFTHFFYIPIILAALWWRRKGLVVAIFLAALIIFSHIFVRAEVVTANDYLRALMFIVIAFVVATLSEQIAKAQEKITHLNAILRAIRNVNQLIAMGKDRDRLLKGACEMLIETHGYHNAWIVLLDGAGGLVTSKEAGWGDVFKLMVERLKRGELPYCGQRALSEPDVVTIHDPLTTCADCPLAEKYEGRGAMTFRLEHDGTLYGLLSVSIPRERTADEEERNLLTEVANDLAFALHSIELEEEREKAEEALQRFSEELESKVEERTKELAEERDYIRHLIESSPDSQVTLDKDGRIMDVNAAFEHIVGRGREDLIGASIYEYRPKEETEKAIAEILEQGKVRNIELPLNIPGKEALLCNVSGMVFTTPEGELGVHTTSRDITDQRRAEEALKKEKNFSANVITTIPDSLLVLDANLRIKCANRSFYEKFQTEPDKVIGSSIANVLGDKDGKLSAALTKLSGTGDMLENFELHYQSEKLGERIFNITAREMLIAEEEKLLVIEDITDRKRAEEEAKKSRRFLDTVIEDIPDPIYIKDRQFRFVEVNKAFCRIHKVTKGEILGVPRYRETDDEVFKTGKELDIPEQHYTDAEGNQHWTHLKKVPLTDESGNITHVLAISHDETEQKQADEMLRESHERLKELNKMKTDFLNVAYHEMRSPLAPIVGYTSLLEQGELDEKQKKYVSIIKESASRLEELIESLLEVTRIEAGNVELTLQTVLIPEIVNNVLERVKPQVDAKKQTISVVVPGGIEVKGDKQKITAIFDNLISNAIKYTGEKGRIDIVVEDRKDEEEIRVCVADTGVGIPEEHLHRVFERFYMVDSSLTRKGGLGLGLAIVKGYVGMHGGKVWVTSEHGKGSKFWFTLPKR